MKEEKFLELLPALSDEEYAALKADIRAKGVMIPIEVDERGAILDGGARQQICNELGIWNAPRVKRIGLTEDQKIEHILSVNLKRRHLSRQKLKKVAAKLRAMSWTQEKIAANLAVSQKTVSNWLDQEFSKISELTSVTGKDGKQYPPKRTERLKEEPHVQEQQENGSSKDAEVSLLLSDLRNAGRQIEEHSVDLILTNSPSDHPDLWQELAILAERVLKPGKLFVLCVQQKRLPKIIATFSKRLQYVWTGTLVLKDRCPISELHIDNDSKLLLFFAAPLYQPGLWFTDTFVEEGRYGEEGGMEDFLIDEITNPGDVIFDPFGSEAVAVAAERLKRRFVRIEKDPDTVAKANQKLETLEPTPPSTKETVFQNEFEQLLKRIAAREKKARDAYGG
jgi:ParB-like chromosome segregation protein Spo0J